MKKKYIFIILIFLLSVICTVGGSTWIILKEQTAPPKEFTAIETKVKVSDIDETIETPTATNLLTGVKFYYGDEETEDTIKSKITVYANINEKEVNLTSIFDVNFDVTKLRGEGTSDSDVTGVLDVSFSFKKSLEEDYKYVYEIPDNIKITVPMYAVAYNEKKFYSSLEGAISAANTIAESGTSTNVVVIPDLGHKINVLNNITINSDVSLYVPFATTKDTNGYYNTGSWDIENGDRITELGKTYADSNPDNVSANRTTLISMQNADIKISEGANLYLGGEFGERGVAGKYCEINLDSSSMIECSGTFYCYGYVKENASSAKNGNQSSYKNYYSNTYDRERLIQVTASGTLKTAMGLYDMKGASDLLNLNNNKIFPLAIFDFPNLQTYLQIDTGGTFISRAHCAVTSSSSDPEIINQEIYIITSDTSKDSIFYLSGENKNVGIEYCPQYLNYTTTTATTRIYLNGEVKQGSLSISVANSFTINTEDAFLPISYKLNIFVNDGATFSTDYQIKFLPGSILQNNTGGKININNNVIFYEKSESGKIANNYPTTYSDAVLLNNGTLTLLESGKLGAFIQTSAPNNSAKLDFSNCENDTVFTVQSIEGENAEIVTETSEGYFEDESEEGKSLYQFKAGTEISSSSTGTKCWFGEEKYSLQTLNIKIAETTFEHNIYAYQIYIANSDSGLNEVEITPGSTKIADTYNIPYSKHIRIAVSRHKNATFDDGTTLDPNKWYEILNDIDVTIEPNEGVAITLTTVQDSGNGSTKFTVLECSSSNGNFYTVDTCTGIGKDGFTVYIVKDWYFKIIVENGVGTTSLDTKYFKITQGPDEYINTTFKTTQAYPASKEYSIHFPRKSCLAAGTLITLADGTQKKVEDLTTNDTLLVFNHETGKYVAANILFIEDDGWNYYNVINLKFSDGTLTRLIYEHALFDITLNKYVYITESNYADFIGHEFAIQDGNSIDTVKLTNAYITNEYTGCYSLVTVYHMNYFIDGLFSIPGGIDGLFNIFEYGKDLKYDEEKMQADIEKYGLFTYEDFKDYIPEEIYNAFPAAYFKVAIGKGMLTFDTLLQYIEQFIVKNGLM